MLAAYGDDAYKIVLTLHILCAIIGFGAVFLNALYGQQAKSRQGAEGLAVSEANELVSKVGEFFIVAVFFLGLALVLMSDDVIGFGQTWVWLSITLFVIAFAVSMGLMGPRARRMIDLQRELAASGPPSAAASGPPPQVLEMEKIGKQMAVIGPFLNIMLIVILSLMVFKPGF
jgi:uncharacterized membrane protein